MDHGYHKPREFHHKTAAVTLDIFTTMFDIPVAIT